MQPYLAHVHRPIRRQHMLRTILRNPLSCPFIAMAMGLAAAGLTGCGGGSGGGFSLPVTPAPAPVATLKCDDSMKTGFTPDDRTKVLLVKAFKQGDALLLSGTATPTTPVAANDICLVKL